MNQVISLEEQTKEQRIAAKGEAIAKTGRVHMTRMNGVWVVGSGNPKTADKWYVVSFDPKLDCFVCDCPAWTYNEGGSAVCCHVLAACFAEGDNV